MHWNFFPVAFSASSSFSTLRGTPKKVTLGRWASAAAASEEAAAATATTESATARRDVARFCVGVGVGVVIDRSID